ncbi:acyl-protein thioesterase 1 [Ophiobolus disseminans]|uniref:Acyl-protein thioesterase 1 n=1 Tax=Ophiobolus disseminans TaxID=1469910 RepID=A0A6A7A334_9PLEO|nr:acyl-protein thioesterase 1 [Ophiobolus disseminans]
MAAERRPPITVPPTSAPTDPSKAAAFIFVHGLGDEAEGVESIARQFQSAGKLPHMTWVLPNALANHDLATNAWYMPTRLSPYPPSRPELEDDEDEQGMRDTVAYLTTLIDDLVAQGIPAQRIVLGGFSQGHAMALLTGLVGKYAGELGGLVGLSGYLPLLDRITALRDEAGLPEHMDDRVEVFLARGTVDRLVPKCYHRLCYEKLLDMGTTQEGLTLKAYEGMGHVMGGAELRDLCVWLERVLPALD